VKKALAVILIIILASFGYSQVITYGRFPDEYYERFNGTRFIGQHDTTLYVIAVPYATERSTIFTANTQNPFDWDVLFELPYQQWDYTPHSLIVSSSGGVYVWDRQNFLLYFRSAIGEWTSTNCIYLPVIDLSECFHQLSGNNYFFSRDTLQTFETIEVLPHPGFLTTNPDGSLICFFYYSDNMIYKFMGEAGNPIAFDEPDSIYVEFTYYHYAILDYMLKDSGELCLTVIWPTGAGLADHYFFSENNGRRYLDRDINEQPDGNALELSMGPSENLILIAESAASNDFQISQDGGNIWQDYLYSNEWGSDIKSVTKSFGDTIQTVRATDYQNSDIEYVPYSRHFFFTTIEDKENQLPSKINLTNHPNPFNAQTTLSFSLEHQSTINISIYDITGRLVEVLTSQTYDAGNHSLSWDAGDQPSGIYFARLTAGEAVKTNRMVLLK